MNYHSITKCDMINGEGLRVTLWVAGCNHNCHNCQNPQTHNPKSGIPFDDSAMSEIYDELDTDWCSGLTISGGDPLYPTNRVEVASLCLTVNHSFPDKTIWLWTGYTFETLLELSKKDTNVYKILRSVDVIIDGTFIEELKDSTLKYRGSSNQRIVDVKRSLKCCTTELMIK